MYNDVLNLPLPEEATVVGYADDVALVVVAKHLEDAELYELCEAIRAVKGWLESSGLTLAEEKTEAILITKRRKRNFARIQIGNHIITSKPAIKYLGVMIDGGAWSISHGGYRQYLFRFKLDISPDCPNCDGVPEDPEHVFFHCPRFVEERKDLEETLGEVLVPENLVRRMVICHEDWDAINSMVVSIHSKLRKAEEIRKARLRTPRRDERGRS